MWQVTFEFKDGSLMSFRSSQLSVELALVSWFNICDDETQNASNIHKITMVKLMDSFS